MESMHNLPGGAAALAGRPADFDIASMDARLWSEARYDAAVAEVEPLLSFYPGTAEYDRAITLIDAIERYETAQGWDIPDGSR